MLGLGRLQVCQVGRQWLRAGADSPRQRIMHAVRLSHLRAVSIINLVCRRCLVACSGAERVVLPQEGVRQRPSWRGVSQDRLTGHRAQRAKRSNKPRASGLYGACGCSPPSLAAELAAF